MSRPEMVLAIGGFGLLAALVTVAPGQRIAIEDPPPALYLTFTNLPPHWQVEVTRDFTNWFTIFISGEIPPGTVSLQLSNTAHAQFYRVVSR